MNSERIRHTVASLCRRYNSRDPFQIVNEMGILLTFEPLGALNGYYTKKYRIKHIHINEQLSEFDQRFACAHELGHAVQHPSPLLFPEEAWPFQSVPF